MYLSPQLLDSQSGQKLDRTSSDIAAGKLSLVWTIALN